MDKVRVAVTPTPRMRVLKLKILLHALWAAVRAAARRVVRGPLLPGWTWPEELGVAFLRRAILLHTENLDRVGSFVASTSLPLKRETARAVTVEPGQSGGVDVEWYRPRAESCGTLFYLHGGGYISGSIAEERRVAADLARRFGCDVVSTEYRLAPEHPFPAGSDDALASYRALLESGVDPEQLFFFGGSAGAGLSLSVLLRARSLGLPLPAGAILLWPYVDLTFAGPSIQEFGDIDLMPLRDIGPTCAAAYAGAHDPADPLISPVFADLTGMPPLLIIVGGVETSLSSAELLAANAHDAGVEAQLSVYANKVHGWALIPGIPETPRMFDEITAWLEPRLRRPRASGRG